MGLKMLKGGPKGAGTERALAGRAWWGRASRRRTAASAATATAASRPTRPEANRSCGPDSAH